MITLGKGKTPASDYGVNDISQLPSAWTTYPNPSAPTTEALFILAAGESVCFNSGTLSFGGNVAFGPTFNQRGCGGAATDCYPNAATFFEFAINMGAGNEETVDLSGVNGTNALLTANLSAPIWTNNVTTASVTAISNPAITDWTSGLDGVYGWQSTWCTSVNDPPNPQGTTCPGPNSWPWNAPQNQTQAICNISRSLGATGGNVEVVFNGWAADSGPGSACVGGYTAFTPSGSSSGGTQVTMTGYGLDQVATVTFQQVAATIVSQTSTQLVVTTPPYQGCASQPNAGVQFTLLTDDTPFTPDVAGTYVYLCP
jgi:hypothetical protein